MYDPGLQGRANSGPISFRVAAPASSIAIEVMAEVQFKGKFTISAFDAKGKLVGRKTVIRQADEGLPGLRGLWLLPDGHGPPERCLFVHDLERVAGFVGLPVLRCAVRRQLREDPSSAIALEGLPQVIRVIRTG